MNTIDLDIFKKPTWYIELADTIEHYFYNDHARSSQESDEWNAERAAFVDQVAALFESGSIALGSEGPYWDANRKVVDSVIIHHTGNSPDVSLWRLEALGLLRLYASAYLNEKNGAYGKAIWSGHFYQERQTFIPYHYLVYPDGKIINILKDEYTGWHAGPKYNPRSIAICFHDRLNDHEPSQTAREAVKQIIRRYGPVELLGHGEAMPDRSCPGVLFYGEKGWKGKLLS